MRFSARLQFFSGKGLYLSASFNVNPFTTAILSGSLKLEIISGFCSVTDSLVLDNHYDMSMVKLDFDNQWCKQQKCKPKHKSIKSVMSPWKHTCKHNRSRDGRNGRFYFSSVSFSASFVSVPCENKTQQKHRQKKCSFLRLVFHHCYVCVRLVFTETLRVLPLVLLSFTLLMKTKL